MSTMTITFGGATITIDDAAVAAELPTQVAPSAEPTVLPVTQESPKAKRTTSKRSAKPSMSGKFVLANVRQLVAEGKFDLARKTCPPTWAQELAAIAKAEARAQEAKPEPERSAKPKADKSKGGTRRSNGHKLDCQCTVCSKVYGPNGPYVNQGATADDGKAKATTKAEHAKAERAAAAKAVKRDPQLVAAREMADAAIASGDAGECGILCEMLCEQVDALDTEAAGMADGAERRRVLAKATELAEIAGELEDAALAHVG